MMNSCGSNWRAINSERKKWKTEIARLTVVLRPDKPMKFAYIKLTRASSTPPDADGLASGGKAILDGLTECGIIEDDALVNIGIPDYRWVKTKPREGWVGLTVMELDNSPYTDEV